MLGRRARPSPFLFSPAAFFVLPAAQLTEWKKPHAVVLWAFPAPGPLAEELHRTWRTEAAFCKPGSGSGWQSLPEILRSLL